jgi:hypothetical protein
MVEQGPTGESTVAHDGGARRAYAGAALAVVCVSVLPAFGCSSQSCSDFCHGDRMQAGQGGGSGGAGRAGSAGVSGGGGSGGSNAAGAGGGVSTVDQTVPEGACVPDGPSVDQLGASRTVVYSGPRALGAIAVRRENLVVADADAGLFRVPLASSAFERVVEARVSDFLAGDLNLYWYEDRAIWRASLSDTDAAPDPVAQNLSAEVAVRAFDETNLYVVGASARVIATVPIAGGATTNLASGVDVRDLELHAGFLYYAELGSKHVLRVSIDGGEPEPLTASAGQALATATTDGAVLYWSDGIAIFAAPIDDGAELEAIGVAGPDASGGHGALRRLHLAGDRLYWSDAAGNLGWTAIDGSECALIVAGLIGLQGWDVDGEAAYVTLTMPSDSSELWRIAL